VEIDSTRATARSTMGHPDDGAVFGRAVYEVGASFAGLLSVSEFSTSLRETR
jgi:hypothetical protein